MSGIIQVLNKQNSLGREKSCVKSGSVEVLTRKKTSLGEKKSCVKISGKIKVLCKISGEIVELFDEKFRRLKSPVKISGKISKTCEKSRHV